MEGFRCLSCPYIQMYPNAKGYTYVCGKSNILIYSTCDIYVDMYDFDLSSYINKICPLINSKE